MDGLSPLGRYISACVSDDGIITGGPVEMNTESFRRVEMRNSNKCHFQGELCVSLVKESV